MTFCPDYAHAICEGCACLCHSAALRLGQSTAVRPGQARVSSEDLRMIVTTSKNRLTEVRRLRAAWDELAVYLLSRASELGSELAADELRLAIQQMHLIEARPH